MMDQWLYARGAWCRGHKAAWRLIPNLCFRMTIGSLKVNFEAGSIGWCRSHLPCYRHVEQSCFLISCRGEVVPMNGCWEWRGHFSSGVRAFMIMFEDHKLSQERVLLVNERWRQCCTSGLITWRIQSSTGEPSKVRNDRIMMIMSVIFLELHDRQGRLYKVLGLRPIWFPTDVRDLLVIKTFKAGIIVRNHSNIRLEFNSPNLYLVTCCGRWLHLVLFLELSKSDDEIEDANIHCINLPVFPK